MTNDQAAMIAAASFLTTPKHSLETDVARARRICALATELLRTLNTNSLRDFT